MDHRKKAAESDPAEPEMLTFQWPDGPTHCADPWWVFVKPRDIGHKQWFAIAVEEIRREKGTAISEKEVRREARDIWKIVMGITSTRRYRYYRDLVTDREYLHFKRKEVDAANHSEK